MTYQMTVSPDFSPNYIAGWYIFNTWLQRQLGLGIHLELYTDFNSQRKAIQNDQVDIIYANPFDASMLIREKGFTALVRPLGKRDEAIIAVNADYPVNCVEDLSPGLRLVATNGPDVNLMGMIMLEPADLSAGTIQICTVASYVIVAKHLIHNDADVGIFLQEAYENLSSFTREQLKVLVQSEISIIHHSLLVGPRLADKREKIRGILLNMLNDPKGPSVLESLEFTGWESVSREDAEFMIDLMNTLS